MRNMQPPLAFSFHQHCLLNPLQELSKNANRAKQIKKKCFKSADQVFPNVQIFTVHPVLDPKVNRFLFTWLPTCEARVGRQGWHMEAGYGNTIMAFDVKDKWIVQVILIFF